MNPTMVCLVPEPFSLNISGKSLNISFMEVLFLNFSGVLPTKNNLFWSKSNFSIGNEVGKMETKAKST